MNEKNNDKASLLQQIQSALPADTSYIFSLVSLSVHNRTIDNIVVGGAVSDFDTFGDLSMLTEEMFEQESEARSVVVESHVFLVGPGESEDMPEHLVKLIEEYGADSFIALDEVDQIARYDFMLDAEELGL